MKNYSKDDIISYAHAFIDQVREDFKNVLTDPGDVDSAFYPDGFFWEYDNVDNFIVKLDKFENGIVINNFEYQDFKKLTKALKRACIQFILSYNRIDDEKIYNDLCAFYKCYKPKKTNIIKEIELYFDEHEND